MINTWGICEFGGIYTTQMVRWDSCCKYFVLKESENGENMKRNCAHCRYWIRSDKLLTEKKK
ncbi:MAG TPA: hypothetical protein VMT12_13645 [Syntrophales bacterium]|nr:hypothetical protein [Syntrophales bacterium]